jgi:hypothetical protein
VIKRADTGSLDRLVAELMALESGCQNPSKVAELFRSIPLTEADLAGGIAPAAGAYSRNLLQRTEHFELLLIRWDAAAKSPIHDHGGERCFMLVCSGTLGVDDYDLLSGGREPGSAHISYARNTRMQPGEIDIRTTERDLHLIEPAGGPATSLHVYAKPIDACLTFDPLAGTCARQLHRYDAVRPGALGSMIP